MSIKNLSLDIDYVRSQFPAFKDPLCINWFFFENAGGSYVPQTVIDRLNNFMKSTKVQPYAKFAMSKIKKTTKQQQKNKNPGEIEKKEKNQSFKVGYGIYILKLKHY